ncbi:MAG: tellurite resistance TerB family protein [Neomegalonema sp.]|nr:tellurite resistance TerB family protein [Neomegalonema sp.]
MTTKTTPKINVMSPEDALIAVMMIASAVDSDMSDREIHEISTIVDILPAFEAYDKDRIALVSDTVIDLLEKDDGLDTIIGLIKSALPGHLRETAYALACDVIAADGSVQLEEMRLLEMMRHNLGIERLNAAAIERGSRARHMRVS